MPTMPPSLVALTAAALLVGCSGSPNERAPSAGDAPPPDAAAQPADPARPTHGFAVGQILPDIRLAGFADDGADLTTIALADLADPDGAKGIRAIVITFGPLDCPDCLREARSLSASYEKLYRARGARFVSVIAPDLRSDPVASQALSAWRAEGVTSYTLLVDDARRFVGRFESYPQTRVVDPRTMEVVLDQLSSDPATSICAHDADCCRAHTSRDEYGELCDVDYTCADFGLCVRDEDPLAPDPRLLWELDRVLARAGATGCP